MIITAEQLALACDCTLMRAVNWVDAINGSATLWGIDTPTRMAAWLAQVSHESGRLVHVREIWGPTTAQRGYDTHPGLGNTQPGDGYRYRGRGLIQLTGRANYIRARDGLRAVMQGAPDFEAQPEKLEAVGWASHSSAWFWADRGLNRFADAGDFMTITRRINGGTNGYSDRLRLWDGARQALGLHP